MSRIPVLTHSPSNPRNSASSPDLFAPERPVSPASRSNTRTVAASSMSAVSYGGSVAETRKKQSKRDEVCTSCIPYPGY